VEKIRLTGPKSLFENVPENIRWFKSRPPRQFEKEMKLKRRPEWKMFKHQKINLKDGSLYLERWVFDLFLFSIRLHHFVASDDDRALHDHPFGFVTCILKGRYGDVTHDANGYVDINSMLPGMIRYRPYTHRHTVMLLDGETCWSLVFTGPVRHRWGFYTKNKIGEPRFVNSQRYFREFGHH
jgi:hypothetical protein